MMKKWLFCLIIFSLSGIVSVQAQENEDHIQKDTADYPYWVEMMGNPNVNFYQTVRAFDLYWEKREIEKGSGFKPFKRWEFGMQMIIDEHGNIPAPGSIEGKIEEYIMGNHPGYGGSGFQGAMNMGPAECLTNGKWVNIGPSSLASNRTSQPNGLGRLNAIAFHPKDTGIIYVGSPAGGLWSTMNGGKTWTSNTDTLPTLGVSAIVVDYLNPDTIYLGTGDRDAGDSYGRGVIRSFDGGKTWQLANTGMGNVIVGKLAIDPNNPSVLIAATNAGLYRTDDFGDSWKNLQTGNFKDVVFHPSNSNVVYAASYASAKFYRSTDNGNSWTNITSGLPTSARRMAIAVTPDDTSMVYLLATATRTFEGSYLSVDNGATFKQMSNTPNIMDYSTTGAGTGGQAWYDLDIAIDPKNASTIYVGGVNIFRSDDSGKTWKINAHWVGSGSIPGIHADQHVLEFSPNGTFYTGNDGGIYKSDNGGTTYTDLSAGLGIAQIYRLNQSATNSDLLINGYQDNGTGLLEKGFWHTILGGDGMDCAIDPKDPSWSFSALYYGDVRRYKNGYYNGRVAANGTNGINESGAWVTPFLLQEGNSSTMFIGYKNVWRSSNIQDSKTNNIKWTKISSGLAGVDNISINHLENSPADPALIYMARSDRKLFKTANANDASPTWTDLTSKLPSTGSIRWVETHPEFKNRVWITQSDNKIYESNDGGNNWKDISNGLPNIPITCILFDSSSIRGGMYAGTYMGVFYTDTAMGKWVWFNSGMPVSSRVTDLDIYYDSTGRSKSHIVASTYGRGNWRSPLYDETQKPPVAEFNASINSGCTDQVIEFEDVSLNTPTRWLWHITPSKVQFTDATDSFSQDAHVRFLSPGSYTVQLKVENCNGIDSIVKTDIIEIFDGIKTANCSPVTRSTDKNYGIGIFNLSIAALDHSSTGTFEEGGYVDRGCKEIVELQTDTSYNIAVTTGRNYSEYVKVYIDYNNDGLFNSKDELVWSDTKRIGLHSGNIYISDTSTTNAIVRMRVISDYDSLSSNACDTLSYGQTEDFGVRLISKKPKPHFLVDRDLLCTNDEVVLTDSSVGLIYSYQWIITGTSRSDTLFGSGPHRFKATEMGSYKVQLSLNDGEGEKTIDSFFRVKPRPGVEIDVKVGDYSLCAGNDLVIEGKDSNNLSNTVNNWFKDDLKLSNASGSEIAYYPASTDDEGSYYLVSEKDGCMDTSNVLDIVIHGNPLVDFDVTADDECVKYNEYEFTNSSSIADSTILVYKWDFGDGSSNNTKNAVKSYNSSGTYTVTLTGTSIFGCTDSDTATLSVLPSPMTGFSIDEFNHCISENMIRLRDTSNFAGTYTTRWDLGDGTTTQGNKVSHSYTSDGSYVILLEVTGDNGCIDSFEKDIIIYEQPVANFGVNDNQQCLEDNNFSFLNTSTVNNGFVSEYTWNTGDGFIFDDKDLSNYKYQNPGTYQVKLEVSSDAGCKDSVTRIVRVGIEPVAEFIIGLNNPCFNEHSIGLKNNSTIQDGSIINWNWDLGDGRIETAKDPAPYQYDLAGNYNLTLVVGSDLGCYDTLSIPVDINPSPELSFDVDIVCEGLETSFSNRSFIETGSITNYLWTLGDGNSSPVASPIHRYDRSGTYNVTLIGTSESGCSDTMVKENAAVVLERPEAKFTYEKLNSWETSTEVKFTDLSKGSVIGWDWEIEGFGYESVQNPTVVFFDSGYYYVQLIVTNDFNCSDTAAEDILIIPETNVYIPNSFSPNGDDLNDLFGVKGALYAQSFRMEIYNRWGAMMFSSNHPDEQWDGTIKNQEKALAGIYIYTINFVDLNGDKFEYNGTINLIR